jgi:flagellar biosynthesis protein FliR
MIAIQPWLDHVVPFLLVTFRLAGLFVAAPLISGTAVPRRIRALIAVMLAAAVYPAVTPPTGIDLGIVNLVSLAVSELLVGASIGAIASIPLAGLTLGGYLMGHQMGLAIARSFNPETNAEDGTLGQLIYFLGIYVFIAIGGLDAMLIGVLNTFQHMPIGAVMLSDAPLDIVLDVLSSSYELAVRLSAPVLGVVLMVLVAMGFLMKTMPQINILSVGFAIKILVGLTILTATLYAIEEVISDEFNGVIEHILSWTSAVS